MSKRVENQKLKACLLGKIKEVKNVLFGAFSEQLSKNDKISAWKEISVYGQSIGAIPPNKDWTYVRDVWWPNVRKATMTKIDNAKSTGSAGGKDKVLNEVDNEILNILGKESPVIAGLDVSESMDSAPAEVEDGANDESCDNVVVASIVAEQASSSKRPLESLYDKSSHVADKKIKAERKLDLQIELLEAPVHKTKLECRMLELQMGLPSSKFTEEFGQTVLYQENDENE